MNHDATNPISSEAFRRQLREAGLIRGKNTRLIPLAGGVSSDIYRVEDIGGRVFVVKRALSKLKTADDWFADVSRNRHELAYLQRLGILLPGAAPRVLCSDPDAGWFAMEYLEGYANWKTLLLDGVCRVEHARAAARALGTIHRATWGDDSARAEFDTTDQFHQLRIDPYLLTAASRAADPALAAAIRAEAARLRETRLCLVHGDYSPKNLLFHGDRLAVLDCEVAWFGDPAFDIGFLLNHLLLKALLFDSRRDDYAMLALRAWREYSDALGDRRADHSGRLLAALMLARVDGKSPVEYLARDDTKRQTIREFAARVILAAVSPDPAELIVDWMRWIGDRWGRL